VVVLAAGVFQGGVLADSSKGAPHGYGVVPPALATRIEGLRGICRRYAASPLAAAVQFPLAHPVVPAVVVGARAPAEIAEVAAMLDQEIPGEFWWTLEREGLITARAEIG
jgi:D-threo-aldose 1-dehydrogenase